MRRLLPALLTIVLAACAPGITLESARQPGAGAGPYRNVLVVGVSQSFERRRFFEQAVVGELAGAGIAATASTARMTTKDPLDRDTIAAIVRALGSDAVFVTRIVNQDVALRQEASRELLKQGNPANATIGSYDPNAYTLFRYDYRMEAEPGRLIVNREAAVRAELFDARTGAVAHVIDARVRLEEGASRSFGADVAVLDRAGRALAGRLLRDRVVARP